MASNRNIIFLLVGFLILSLGGCILLQYGKVTGGGWILSQGDPNKKASFGFNVQECGDPSGYTTIRGNFTYNDLFASAYPDGGVRINADIQDVTTCMAECDQPEYTVCANQCRLEDDPEDFTCIEDCAFAHCDTSEDCDLGDCSIIGVGFFNFGQTWYEVELNYWSRNRNYAGSGTAIVTIIASGIEGPNNKQLMECDTLSCVEEWAGDHFCIDIQDGPFGGYTNECLNIGECFMRSNLKPHDCPIEPAPG